MTTWEWIADGGVTSPAGFVAGTAACGLKQSGRPDVALLWSAANCRATAVFTQNQVVAAPVIVDRATLAANPARIRAVAANAGIANACTGEPGLAAARETQRIAAYWLGCAPDQVLLLSTGVIGVQLPMERVAAGIETAAAALDRSGGAAAAQAIMTTDTRPKATAVRVQLGQGTISIGGMAKGAGMIHPDMATMLAVITTDAAIDGARLPALLRTAVDQSFNCISVDGDTSTNDTVLLLANGASGVPVDGEADQAAFAAGLAALCQALAQMIVRDGEGASRFVTIRVTGAPDDGAARQVARTIATSPLVKTAVAGGDPNWGRILAAAGRSGVPFDQSQAALWIAAPGGTPLQLVAGGTPAAYAEAAAAAIFGGAEIELQLALGHGEGAATVWTCDLTHEYVRINADYRT